MAAGLPMLFIEEAQNKSFRSNSRFFEICTHASTQTRRGHMANKKDKEKESEEEEKLWKKIEELVDAEEFKQFKKNCKDERVLASELGDYTEEDLSSFGLSKKGDRKRIIKHFGGTHHI